MKRVALCWCWCCSSTIVSMLLVLLLQPRSATAQPTPCPISGPVFNYTGSGALPTIIPSSGNAVINLLNDDVGGAGFYSLPSEQRVASGQIVCVVGGGAAMTAVLTVALNGSRHFVLEAGGWLHLENLVISGEGNNSASIGGGIATATTAYGDRKLTTNRVIFGRCLDSAIHVTTALTAHLHSTEFNTNSGQNGAAIFVLQTDAGGNDTAVLRFSDDEDGQSDIRTAFFDNSVRGAGPGAGLGGALYLGSHTAIQSAPPRVQVVFGVSITGGFSRNAARAGGAIFIDGGVDLRFQSRTCTFDSNSVSGGGNLTANTDALGGALMVMNTDPNKPASSYVELGCSETGVYDNVASAANASASLSAKGAALYLAAPGAGDIVFVNLSGLITSIMTNQLYTRANSTGGALSVHAAGEVHVNAQGCLAFADNSAPNLPANVGVEGLDIGIATDSGGVAKISVGAAPTGSLRFGNSATATGNVALVGAGSSIQCGSKTPKSAGSFFFQCDMCDAVCNNVATGGGTCNACSSSAPNCNSPPPCPGNPPAVPGVAWSCGAGTVAEGICNGTCLPGFAGLVIAGCQGPDWYNTTLGNCTRVGCSAPPPTGGPSTLITGYANCSAQTASDGTYPITTSCVAACQAGASGGFASCGLGASQFPSWQLHGCRADCSGNPPAVPGAVWSCGTSTVAGGTCGAACLVADGFAGGPVTATCLGPAWSNTTIGSCTRVACIGPPPQAPPNATFSCKSTPVGSSCRSVCSPGLTGSLRRTCQADGTFGQLEGDPCVDCAANKPQLEAVGASASFPAGATVLSATFTFTARYIKGTTKLTPKLDGFTTGCTTELAQLNGAQVEPASITVSCQAVAGGSIRPGPHTVGLAAEFTGANGCSSGSLSALATVLVADTPIPAPLVELSAAAGAAAPACRAASQAPTTISAEFNFAVTGAAGALQLDLSGASAAGATCSAKRMGGSVVSGKIGVTCRGVFSNAVNSLDIHLTLKARTPGGLVGSATSSQVVALVCCLTTAALAVDTAGDCLTCRGAAASGRDDGAWLQGVLTSGVMRSGALAAETCSSVGPDVGSINTTCNDGDKLLTVTVTSPPGSSTTLQYMAKCETVETTAGAACGSSWLTANGRRNALQVSKSASATIATFNIRMAPSACRCSQMHYAVRQAGVFGQGVCGGRHRF